MGITVHYRGRIADLDRVEEFEDRVLDLVLDGEMQEALCFLK